MSALHNAPSYLLLAFIVALCLALCWFFITMRSKAQYQAGQDRRQELAPHEVDWLTASQKDRLDAQQVRDLAARSAGIDIASDAAFITPNPFSPGTLNHAVWRNQYARTLDGIHTGTAQPKDAA